MSSRRRRMVAQVATVLSALVLLASCVQQTEQKTAALPREVKSLNQHVAQLEKPTSDEARVAAAAERPKQRQKQKQKLTPEQRIGRWSERIAKKANLTAEQAQALGKIRLARLQDIQQISKRIKAKEITQEESRQVKKEARRKYLAAIEPFLAGLDAHQRDTIEKDLLSKKGNKKTDGKQKKRGKKKDRRAEKGQKKKGK